MHPPPSHTCLPLSEGEEEQDPAAAAAAAVAALDVVLTPDEAIAAEKVAFKGYVPPSRLKFSIKPRTPKISWWRPKQKLAFVVRSLCGPPCCRVCVSRVCM